MRHTQSFLLVLILSIGASFAHAASDILISDFEFTHWSGSGWTATGSAFGEGPATGPIGRQMPVLGYKGSRLVNSFWGGSDRATGTLTLPAFIIERPYINFLIGGGGWAGKTCVNLVIDGIVMRTATGDNTERGGSENLGWKTWDVTALIGKSATLQFIGHAAYPTFLIFPTEPAKTNHSNPYPSCAY
jgi:fructan beta-fructosidase